MREKRLTKFFTYFLAFVPIISIYASPFPGFTLGEVILVAFWGYLLLHRNQLTFYLDKTDTWLLGFVAFVYFSFFLSAILTGNMNTAALTRTVRYTFFYISSVFLIRRFVDCLRLFDLMIKVGIFATVYLGLQYLVYYGIHDILPGTIPGLPIYLTNYTEIDYASRYETYFRPTSIFLEPANYVQYIIPVLCIVLWYKKNFRLAAFFTLGILLSTSGQGLIIGGAVWLLFIAQTIWDSFNGRKIQKRRMLLIVAGLILSMAVISQLWQTDIVQKNLGRLSSTGDLSAANARMGSLALVIDSMQGISALIGNGFGNVIEGTWNAAMSYVLYGTGIIGFSILMIYFGALWLTGKRFEKAMVVVFLLLFVQASIFMNIIVILYIALLKGKKDWKLQVRQP